MKLENQICDIDQSKLLEKLGIIQHISLVIWHDSEFGISPLFRVEKWIRGNQWSAFTVAELGVMLGENWEQEITADYNFTAETEAQERAHYLIGALQSKQLSQEECNKRLSES